MPRFADWLSERRKNKNLTQDELARGLDVTTRQISRWETGEAVPTRNRLRTIARYFRVDEDGLIGAVRGDGQMPPRLVAPPPLLLTFFASERLNSYAKEAGMESAAEWISRFPDWLESMPESFRTYIKNEVRKGYEPQADSLISRSGDADREADVDAGKKPEHAGG